MYKNLSPKALGITGRQSEIIELALTYGFRGVELDIGDFVKRVAHRGLDHATRFIRSAHINIGGFELPVKWRGDEALYRADLEELGQNAECAASAGAGVCHTGVFPSSDSLPYHENFELHRQRLAEMAETLAKHEIRLAVGFFAAPSQPQEFQFIRDAEALVTLVKSVSAENVGLMLDTWHWRLGGGTPELLRTVGADGVVSVHIADAPEDADLAAITEEQRLLPGASHSVDNVGALTLLNELGYRGPVTLVPHPKCFSGMTRDAIVQRSSNSFEDLWRSAGLSRTGKFTPAAASGA